MIRGRTLCLAIGLVTVLGACSEDAPSGLGAAGDGGADATGSDATRPVADGGADGASPLSDATAGDGGWGQTPDGGCAVVHCQSHVYQCGNCIDDDRDGLTDWQDPDCLGPCDNGETGLDLAIPGGGSAPCRLVLSVNYKQTSTTITSPQVSPLSPTAFDP